MPKKIGTIKGHRADMQVIDETTYMRTVIDYTKAVYFDPGDRYTGVAVFEKDDFDQTWDCTDAFTWDVQEPGHEIEMLQTWLWTATARGEFDIVGYEVWRLFEDKAQEQKGKEFLATQLIGVIKYAVHMHAVQNRWPRQPLEIVRFMPEHKKPTMGKLRKMGVTFEADRRGAFGDHARDAELQGYYDIIHNRGWAIQRKAPKS